MKKKIYIILFLIVVLGLSICLLYAYQRQQLYNSISITFKVNDKIEYGSDMKISDLIESYDGELIEYTKIDTSKVGEQTLIFVLKKENVEREFEKVVIIEDTQKPVIELKEEKVIIDYNKSIDPNENIIKVYDVVDGDLEYEITHDIKIDVAGDYEVSVKTTDKNQNVHEVSFIVTVKEKPVSSTTIPTLDVITMEPTYINGILIVNKQYGIPSSFGGTNSIASNALKQLQNGANAAGYSMPLISGYRSYSYQKSLYNGYVAKHGVKKADTFSARPGHSEHQTGLAFDVGSIDDNYGNTAAGQWLKENCAKYGFIIRYPKGKEYITGYKYEPWHIRYVGVEHATAIMSQGITLEEYLGVTP